MRLSLGMELANQQRAAFWADPFRVIFRDGGKGALLSSAAPAANWTTDAGVTLAGFGDPVGLALDTKTGLALGPETLPTWDLTAWTIVTAPNLVSRTATQFVYSGAGGLALASVFEVGKTYELTVLGQSSASGFSVNTTPNDFSGRTEIISGFGTARVLATQPGLYLRTASAATVDISNISIREIPCAHFSTAVTADRLTRGREPLGGVRNLLDASEDFASPWLASNASLTVDSGVALINVTSGSDSGLRTEAVPASPGQEYTLEVDASAQVGTWELRLQYFNGASFVGQSGPTAIAATGSALQRYKRSGVIPAGADTVRGYVRSTSGAGSQCLVAKPQLETGSTATAYQNRTTINDITEAGVPDVPFWRHDGVSDRLLGNATARDILKDAPGVTFICAFRPASTAAQQYLFSFSVGGASSVRAGVRVGSSGELGRLSLAYRRLDADSAVVATSGGGGSVVGQTKILTVTADFANGGTGALVFRENGQVVGTADIAGTGNFSDTTSQRAYLGALTNDSLFTNGQLFREVVILGRRASDAEIAAAEARLAALTGVTLS